MPDHCSGHLDAAVSHETQTKRQVDVLDITEKPFVKAVCLAKDVGTEEAGRGARRKYLTLRRQFRYRPATAAAPRNPGREIMIARSVEPLRICSADLRGAEHDHVGVAPRCREQLLQPIRGGHGVRIEKGKPFTARRSRAKITACGKAKIAFRINKYESFVLAGGRPRAREGLVGRTVIDDNCLEIGEGLGGNR